MIIFFVPRTRTPRRHTGSGTRIAPIEVRGVFTRLVRRRRRAPAPPPPARAPSRALSRTTHASRMPPLHSPQGARANNQPPSVKARDTGFDRTRPMTNTIVLKVAMMCGGCSGAVERVLGKLEGASPAFISHHDDSPASPHPRVSRVFFALCAPSDPHRRPRARGTARDGGENVATAHAGAVKTKVVDVASSFLPRAPPPHPASTREYTYTVAHAPRHACHPQVSTSLT